MNSSGNGTAESDSSQWKTYQSVLLILEALIGLLTVVTNGIDFAATLRSRYLQQYYSYSVCSVAIANILAGLLVPTLVVTVHFGLPSSFHGCVTVNSLAVTFLTISTFNLVCVDFDRYYSIVYSDAYSRVVSIPRTLALIALSWALGIFVGLIPVMGFHKDPAGFERCSYIGVIDIRYNVYVRFYGILVPSILLMTYFHIHIFITIRQANATVSHDDSVSPLAHQLALQRKLFRTLTLIIVVIVVTWVPINILDCIIVWSPSTKINWYLLQFTILLSHTTFAIVPLLFARTQHGFLWAAIRIACICFNADRSKIAGGRTSVDSRKASTNSDS